MQPLPHDLLDLPAETGARRVALHFLAEAADAFPRLEQPDDAEALHDFRVGLRRLRSALRSYESQLAGSLSKQLRRKLRRLARATGARRDAEVHAEWLAEQRGSLAADEQAGVAFFAARLAETRRDADEALGDEVVDRFPRLRGRVAARLRRYTATIDVERPDATTTFATVSAALLHQLATEMETKLAAVRGIEDQEEAHEARIAGKRLRYALEPLAGLTDGVAPLIKQLKRMQDALGDLHDAHIFAGEVEALAAAVHDDADENDGAVHDPRPGLTALAGRLHSRRDASFAEAERWLSGSDRGELLAGVRRAALALEARAGADVEVERKYLLNGLPDEARQAESKEIDQGYLPGERLVERVRRVRTAGGERYLRTMKLGGGVRRVEIEEATTPELFERLWALTEGRRVRKRRHLVPDGALTWEIDDFADRDLVLAEVELPPQAADTSVAIPAWLAPFVVRDVTGEPEYANARLAH